MNCADAQRGAGTTANSLSSSGSPPKFILKLARIGKKKEPNKKAIKNKPQIFSSSGSTNSQNSSDTVLSFS